MQLRQILVYDMNLHLHEYFVCDDSEDFGETVWMQSLSRTFSGILCDKYPNTNSYSSIINSLHDG